MFLYFYESKTIVGLNKQKRLFVKECDDFDINDEKEDDHLFNGWEREENEDGTFYLVFITKKQHKYYLRGSRLCQEYAYYDEMVQTVSLDIKKAQKLVLDEEETILFHETKYKLHSRRDEDNDTFYLSLRETVDDPLSRKVCLTETSNINNCYVLK
jgi:hypothetical protein